LRGTVRSKVMAGDPFVGIYPGMLAQSAGTDF